MELTAELNNIQHTLKVTSFHSLSSLLNFLIINDVGFFLKHHYIFKTKIQFRYFGK